MSGVITLDIKKYTERTQKVIDLMDITHKQMEIVAAAIGTIAENQNKIAELIAENAKMVGVEVLEQGQEPRRIIV